MACLYQDPDWWKRAQLLLAKDVEGNPGPMWYCALCTHKITPYQTSIQCNHTTPRWIHLKCTHTKLKSYSSSFVFHMYQIATLKYSPHTHNPTQKTSIPINKLNQSPKTSQPLHTHTPLTTPNNINIIQLKINSITKKTTELTHLIHKRKNTYHHTT